MHAPVLAQNHLIRVIVLFCANLDGIKFNALDLNSLVGTRDIQKTTKCFSNKCFSNLKHFLMVQSAE